MSWNLRNQMIVETVSWNHSSMGSQASYTRTTVHWAQFIHLGSSRARPWVMLPSLAFLWVSYEGVGEIISRYTVACHSKLRFVPQTLRQNHVYGADDRLPSSERDEHGSCYHRPRYLASTWCRWEPKGGCCATSPIHGWRIVVCCASLRLAATFFFFFLNL